jgi:hypothetical protein
MSAGFLPDAQYSFHWVLDFRPRRCTYLRASLKDRDLPGANLRVPSQSLIPAQLASAYVVCGLAGMSRGFLPDLQYVFHSVEDFNPRRRTFARAFLKG